MRDIRATLLGAALCATIICPLCRGQDTTRVSTDASGVEGNDDSIAPSLSADGRIVVFESFATNLVSSDQNSYSDVFVVDRTTTSVTRASVGPLGAEANGYSEIVGSQAVSSDGSVVTFTSNANNLVPGDSNSIEDVFVRDMVAGTTERISVDSTGREGNGKSWWAGVSSNGIVVAFSSFASNLVTNDTNGVGDVFVHDRGTGVTERVSIDSFGSEGNANSGTPSISSDGRYVAFSSDATDLVSGDTNGKRDIFVHDRLLGTTECVSVSTSGGDSDGNSDVPSISGDGQLVAFQSRATNLVTNDTNGFVDVFLRNRTLGSTIRCSTNSAGTEGNGNSNFPMLSPRGLTIVFSSSANNLVSGDANGQPDVFAYSLVSAAIEQISVDSTGVGGNDSSAESGAVSENEQVFSFDSIATNLVPSDTNGRLDVFVHERCSVDASWSNYGGGLAGTFGVPTLTSQQNPVLGTTISIDVSNSYGMPTAGLMLVGLQQGSFHTRFGSDVLVVPLVLMPISFSFGSDSFVGLLSNDPAYCGTSIFTQVVELDPGAPFGVSFSQGMELVLAFR